MKKEVTLSLLVISLVLLSACDLFTPEEIPPEEPIIEQPIEEVEEIIPLEEPEPEVDLSCTHNANCTWGKLCIAGECLVLAEVLADLYPPIEDCEKTCKFTNVEVLTSDGETYNLPPGQGSYTAAGALDWTISSGTEYCQGETAIIPIKILKRNYGQIFSDEVILLKVGETSKVIKHPSVTRVAFTLTINSIEETCS